MTDKITDTMPVVHRGQLANAIRMLTIDAVERAKSGHPGLPMGMADVITVLFQKFFKFYAEEPKWFNRDRFVLSAGHGSMLLYSLAYLTGIQEMPLEQLKNFRQLGSYTPGHPEIDPSLGIETTTGPLGQGLANAVGMALSERLLNAEFGNALIDHYTYVLVGDGCLSEGISQEAISFAGHYKLHKLIVLFDDNKITIDGPTSLSISEDMLKRFEACGWHTQRVNGHDHHAIEKALSRARINSSPSFIAFETVIGRGAPTKQGTAAIHGAPIGEEEVIKVRKNLEWGWEPFEIPEQILQAWRDIGIQGQSAYQEWQELFDGQDEAIQQELHQRIFGQLPQSLAVTFQSLKKELKQTPRDMATRQHSHNVLEKLCARVPSLIGGSADLTPSNNTKTTTMQVVKPGNYKGTYIHYGIREHAMAGIMNGLAVHGGLIPYGGTFLAFSDYCRAGIRLSALMEKRVIYVMTHDSIGLGEDGPTHQPVEHLAALRAMPNLHVFRPADGIETIECWELALENVAGPSILALTRQTVPQVRLDDCRDNLCQYGAYVLKEAEGKRAATLLATGSEVSIALEAQKLLASKDVDVAVVSMPCWELFKQQDQSYQEDVLGSAKTRVAIEAAVRFGWDQFIGAKGKFIGMQGFGLSAPGKQLFKNFDITPEKVVEKVLELQ